MTDAPIDAPRGKEPRKSDMGLNIALALLLVAVVGLAGWFGYSVWRDRQADRLTQAPNRVVDALIEQVRKAPNDVVLRVRLGEALGAARRYPEAIEQLNAALKIEPEHVGAHLDLGMIALLTRKEAEAERYLRRVVELTDGAQFATVDERREKALYNLGLLKLEQKEYEEAAGFFKGALRIRKDASDTYLALAHALEGMGEIDGAIDNINTALAFDPGYAEAHYNLGLLYQQKQDDVKASYHFRKAVDNAPDADLPREALESYGTAAEWLDKAKSAQAAGDDTQALNFVLVARNLDVDDVGAVVLHGTLLEKSGEVSNALEIYLNALDANADDATLKSAVARIEKDSPKEALSVYERASKAKPADTTLKEKVSELKKRVKQ